MTFQTDISPAGNFISFFKKPLITLFAIGMVAFLSTGCDSSTSANDEEDKISRTFDLVLSSDNSTKVGTITTSEITKEDDAFIDDGFFITIKLSDSGFSSPYDINMTDNSGHCGTFDVEPDERAEMPCNYEYFLSNPAELTVTSDDGNGEEAYPE